ncbi:hypothetical protein [Kineococcus sp. SYSU DK006]|uniref:hypothetical protein n=1 Tax=Kineococcus sp. SYSU DK006 TaxID=3383127 RepID=UPI003D7DA9CF
MQSYLRSWRQRPGERLLIALDEDEQDEDEQIAAMSAYLLIEPGRVLLQALAVSVRHRSRGAPSAGRGASPGSGAVARRMLQATLEQVVATAARDADGDLLLEGRVHIRNQPSKRLLTTFGFAFDAHLDDELESWLLDLPAAALTTWPTPPGTPRV